MTGNTSEPLTARIQVALRPHLRFLDPHQPVPMDDSLGKLGLEDRTQMAVYAFKTGLVTPDQV